jgi:hypothetical protein
MARTKKGRGRTAPQAGGRELTTTIARSGRKAGSDKERLNLLAKVVTEVERADKEGGGKKDNPNENNDSSSDESEEDGDDEKVDSEKEGDNSESEDESSVESEAVNEMSAKARENAKKKKKKKGTQSNKKGGNTTVKKITTTSSSSTTTPVKETKKRKAVSKSNDNTPIKKSVKINKITDACDEDGGEDVKVRVEESIVVRDKKGIDKYVKRNNKLDDITSIQEDHYRKTINYLLNKKTTAEKELSKMRNNQTDDRKHKELKDLNVKMHAWVSQILARNSLKFEIMYPTSVVKSCIRCFVSFQISTIVRFFTNGNILFLFSKILLQKVC